MPADLIRKKEFIEYYKKVFPKRILDGISLKVDDKGEFLPDYFWLLENLKIFHKICLKVCEPQRELQMGWYFDYYFDFLREILEKRNSYLIINIAPGHGKTSVLISFVCLYLGFFPHTRVLITSGTDKVREKYKDNIKIIINSSEYKQLFPQIKIDENRKNNVGGFFIEKFNYEDEIEGGGQVIIKSIKANLTGTDSDFYISDDPIDYNVYKEQGNDYLDKVNSVVASAILRDRGMLNTKTPFILCMQRIADNDTVGFLSRLSSYNKMKHIKIPAKIINGKDIYENKITSEVFEGQKFYRPYFKNRPIFVKNGDFIFPEMFNNEKFEIVRDLVNNEIDFQWQYFQECSTELTQIFNINCLNYYTKEDLDKVKFEKTIISIDSSQGGNDYQSMQLWGFYTVENNITKRKEIISYLIKSYLSQEKTPDFFKTITEWYNKYCPAYFLIEKASSGNDIYNDLEILHYGRLLKDNDCNKEKYIIGINPRNSKEDRAMSVSCEVNNSRVFFPKEDKTIAKLDNRQIEIIKEGIRQLNCFPSKNDKVHDDFVDAMTQALNWARAYFNKNNKREFRVRIL